jgi:hypothetical protein
MIMFEVKGEAELLRAPSQPAPPLPTSYNRSAGTNPASGTIAAPRSSDRAIPLAYKGFSQPRFFSP